MKKIDPNKLRNHILDMVYKKNSGHIGGSFSICELISCLYEKFHFNEDKLILSKGHAVPALYAAFYELGLIDELDSFREVNSILQGHPDKNKLSLLHATTGSLGQGLSIAIGHALANKTKKNNKKVVCIVGDGEMQEGQIWEAFMFAPKYKLDNLICFIDYNKAQNDSYVNRTLSLGDLESKILSFGWKVIKIDGHDQNKINSVIDDFRHISNHPGGVIGGYPMTKNPSYENDISIHVGEHTSGYVGPSASHPYCVILDTIKGKGVSFMEGSEWHAKVPSEEEYIRAKKELENL